MKNLKHKLIESGLTGLLILNAGLVVYGTAPIAYALERRDSSEVIQKYAGPIAFGATWFPLLGLLYLRNKYQSKQRRKK